MLNNTPWASLKTVVITLPSNVTVLAFFGALSPFPNIYRVLLLMCQNDYILNLH
uniref:Uncharacterized protein n=1 Tax=Lepeophtheirus salmonis TaxID=72036 RepID=A0A0K2TDD0_LEPSM